jgi:hypothetical protein
MLYFRPAGKPLNLHQNPPQQVVDATLAAIAADEEEVVPDQAAARLQVVLREDHGAEAARAQRVWDEKQVCWSDRGNSYHPRDLHRAQLNDAPSPLLSSAGIGSHHQKSGGAHKCRHSVPLTDIALKPHDERPVPGLAWSLANDRVGREAAGVGRKRNGNFGASGTGNLPFVLPSPFGRFRPISATST